MTVVNYSIMYNITFLHHAETGPPPKKRSKLEPDTSSASGLDTKLGEWKPVIYFTWFVTSSFHHFRPQFRPSCFKVSHNLQSLEEDHISTVGGALGLSYSKLRKITKYPSDMVAAWLRREDFVSGEPTWRTLVEALRKVGQEGTARDNEKKESRSNNYSGSF